MRFSLSFLAFLFVLFESSQADWVSCVLGIKCTDSESLSAARTMARIFKPSAMQTDVEDVKITPAMVQQWKKESEQYSANLKKEQTTIVNECFVAKDCQACENHARKIYATNMIKSTILVDDIVDMIKELKSNPIKNTYCR